MTVHRPWVGESGPELITALNGQMIEPENALRWEVKAHVDDNTCEKCKGNDGKLYKSRAAAYKDYPRNKGYKHCVGAKFGNNCRCRVVKRGRGKENVARDFAALIDRARALTAGMSADGARPIPPAGCTLGPAPANKLELKNEASTNKLYLYNSIGGWSGIQAIDVAMALADLSGPLDVHLNSPGGFIFEGTAIFNAIKAYAGGPVAMYVDGYAASAASFIAMAADPYDKTADTGGIRIAKNAVMMIHDGQGGAIGTADDLRDVADLLDMLSDTIAATYADRAGGDAETWRETMQAGDTWYNSAEALKAGLADVITGEVAVPDEDDDEPDNVVRLDWFRADARFEPAAFAPLADSPLHPGTDPSPRSDPDTPDRHDPTDADGSPLDATARTDDPRTAPPDAPCHPGADKPSQSNSTSPVDHGGFLASLKGAFS